MSFKGCPLTQSPIYHSSLFSILLSSAVEIPGIIQEIPGSPPEFIMEESVRTAWSNLEHGLLAVVEVLISRHPKAWFFPTFTFPRLPSEYGYESIHKSHDSVVTSAKQARGAFHSLSALATFALILWLNRYEDTCFNGAFSELGTASRQEIPPVWLDLLQKSIVCNLSAGVHPGGFLDPYTTYWGWAISQLCKARAPIWFKWGKSGETQSPANSEIRSEYYPPLDILQCIKSCPADFQRIIMPFFDTYHFDPPAHSSGSWQEAPTQQLAATSSKPQAYPPPQTQHSSTVDHSGFHNPPQNLQTNPHAGSVHAGSGQWNRDNADPTFYHCTLLLVWKGKAFDLQNVKDFTGVGYLQATWIKLPLPSPPPSRL